MDEVTSHLFDTLGVDGVRSASSILQADASQFGNDAGIEYFWATKAHKHAEVYMKLISSFDPKKLKLTKFDDIIYRNFKRYFKDVNIEVINEDDFKTEEAKASWRPFCELFKDKVEDYNFATLMRKDASKDYTEENSILVTRIQFFAVEIARNRRGLNTFHLDKNNEALAAKQDENHNKTEDVTDKLNLLYTNLAVES